MTIRAFIAVDVSISDTFFEFQKALKDTGARLKMTNQNSLHLTLKFLGDIAEEKVYEVEKAMVRSVDGMQPITGCLRGTGVFPSEEKIRVIWVGLDGAESILDIAESLEEELERYGFDPEERTFIPHLTAARTKFDRRGGPDPNISKILPVVQDFSSKEFGELRIDRLKLMKSELTPQGPIYSVVKEVAFF